MVIRTGLIGAGAIGTWHARILAESAQSRLVAICDRDPDRAAALAKPYGATPHTDETTFFAHPMDAVIIATPEAAHESHLRAAARAGLPVLIEKPVGTTLAEIDRMAAAVDDAGIIAMAAHVERFEAGSAGLHAAMAQDIAGPVTAIMARRQFSPGGVERFAGLSTTLRILAIHDFDLIRWLHPAAIASVHAVGATGPIHAFTGLHDHVVTTIRFADGAIAMVESGWTLPASFTDFRTPAGWQGAGNNRIEVFGRDGMLSNDMGLRHQQLVAFTADEGFRAAGLRHQPVIHGRVQGALRAEVEHFLDCVQTGAQPLCTLADARRAVALLEAAETSLRTGQPQDCAA
jgi:myo-inositol 2-dehydrogenase/D-chiro-inositol 1-dehydrogenase